MLKVPNMQGLWKAHGAQVDFLQMGVIERYCTEIIQENPRPTTYP
jgi:hypothetical protein